MWASKRQGTFSDSRTAGPTRLAKFVYELFPEISAPFSGVLRITAVGTPVAVVGLRGRALQAFHEAMADHKSIRHGRH